MIKSIDDTHEDPEGRRSHFRVPTRLPLVYQVLDPTDVEHRANEILAVLEPPELDLDPGLKAWLDRIDRKLDQLLSSLEVGPRPLFSSEDATEMMLSGSGMSFEADHEIPTGTDLLVDFEIPGDRARAVRCLARVVHCSKPPDANAWTVGLAFTTIRTADEDAVVRYTVEVQRQRIRAGHPDPASD